MNIKKIFLILSFGICFFSPKPILAQDVVNTLPTSTVQTQSAPLGSFTYKTLVRIPGLGTEEPQPDGTKANVVTISPNSLGLYLQTIFNYIIGLAIALATVMIIYGGVRYSTTDALGGKKEGKAIVQDALWGLALALGSYLILNTINPDLLKFDLDLPKVEKIDSSVGGKVSAAKFSAGSMGLGTGATQNGQTFTSASNRLIVKCPSALTAANGWPICPEFLQKLQSAASAAGVTITVTQTFKKGGGTPSKSDCHQPGGTSPYAGSCADVAVNGAVRNSPKWDSFCQAVGSTPGLFTNNEASNSVGCTKYVGKDNTTNASTGPHLHILYTGGSGGGTVSESGDGSFGGDPRGAYLEGTYDNPVLSAGVPVMIAKLKNGSKITKILVKGTSGSSGQISFFLSGQAAAAVTLPVKVGANGMSEIGQGVPGDKKTPKGTYSLGSRRGPQRTPILVSGGPRNGISMGLGVFNVDPKRSIHLHGTRNDPQEPTSGCVRMRNDDIVGIGPYLSSGAITVEIK